MKPILRILVVGVVLALLLSACGSVNYGVYGAWADSTNGTTAEFLQSGRLRIGGQGMVQDFPFKFGAPGVFTYQAPDQAGGMTDVEMKYILDGDTLTLVLDPTPLVFKRIK
jgi:hypothetical protein